MALAVLVGLLLADCAPAALHSWPPNGLSAESQGEAEAEDLAGAWLEVVFHREAPDGVRRVRPDEVTAVPLPWNPAGTFDVKVWLPGSYPPNEAEKLRIVVEAEHWRNATSSGASWLGDGGRYIAFVLEPNGEPRAGLVNVAVQGVREAEGSSGSLRFSFEVVEGGVPATEPRPGSWPAVVRRWSNRWM